MSKKLSAALATALLASGIALVTAPPASAATLTVCAAGCDHTTIKAAVLAAGPNDTINVGAGTYNESNIVINKPLTIDGAGPGATIVDGQNSDTAGGPAVFSIAPIEATSGTGAITISDLTAKNAVRNSTTAVAVVIQVKLNRPTTGITAVNVDNVDVLSSRASAVSEFPVYLASGVSSGVDRQNPSFSFTNGLVQGHSANGILLEDWKAAVTIANSELYDAVPGQGSAVVAHNSLSATRYTAPYTYSGNTVHGSGFSFQNIGTAAARGGFDQVNITNNTFVDVTGNDTAMNFGNLSAGFQTENKFGQVVVTGNTVRGEGPTATNTYGVRATGLADNLRIENNSIVGVRYGIGIRGAGGSGPAVTARANRIFADVSGIDNTSTAAVNAEGNWWGCQAGPTSGSPFCSPVTGSGAASVDSAPWVLTFATVTPSPVVQGASAAVATDLLHLSDGTMLTSPTAFSGLVVARSAGTGTVTPPTGTMTNGVASAATYTSATVVCPDTVTVTVDREVFGPTTVTGQPVTVSVCVNRAATTPTVTTTTSAATTFAGEPISDSVTVSGLFAPYSATVTGTLYGPFTSLAAATCVPANRFGSVTWSLTGNGTFTTPSLSPTVPGVYTWVQELPANANNLAVRTACGLASETTTVRALSTPTVTTTTSAPQVYAGSPITDRVTIAGLEGAYSATATGRLYGPFTSLAAASCTPANQFGAVTWTATGNGTFTTPSLSPTQPGVYTWVQELPANRANVAVRTACGIPAETTVVEEQGTPTVVVRASGDGTTVYDPIKVAAKVAGLKAPYAQDLELSLYGPFRTASAIICTPDHLLVTRSVDVTAPTTSGGGSFTPTVRGHYAWVARLPANAGNRAVTTACGVDSATTRVKRANPTLRGKTSDRRVSTGEAFHEIVKVRGKRGTAPTLLKVTLHGPSNGRPVVKRFTLEVGPNGTYLLPEVSFRNPGVYIWRIRMKGDETNRKVKQDGRLTRQTTVVQSG